MRRSLLKLASASSIAAVGLIGVNNNRKKTVGVDSGESTGPIKFSPEDKSIFGNCMPRVLAYGREEKLSEVFYCDAKKAFNIGIPNNWDVLFKQDHIISYDRRTKVPHWVFEYLSVRRLDSPEPEYGGDPYRVDPDVDANFSADWTDYAESCYLRGFLAPACNHKKTMESYSDTYLMSNISPQVGEGFSSPGGAWATLNQKIQCLTMTYGNAYVMTGPLYLHRSCGAQTYVQYPVIGKNWVHVPTHYFKVVVCRDGNNQYHMWAFKVENKAYSCGADVNCLKIDIDQLQKESGLEFFPGELNFVCKYEPLQ